MNILLSALLASLLIVVAFLGIASLICGLHFLLTCRRRHKPMAIDLAARQKPAKPSGVFCDPSL